MDCKERILSEQYADTMADYPLEEFAEPGADACYIPLGGDFYVAYTNRDSLGSFGRSPYQYRYIPKLYGLMQTFDPGALIAAGSYRLQGNPLNLTGRGVVLCFIDTGIDYTNAAFRDENGDSRILAIWDQTIQDGPAPEGYYYGTEYTREEINRALRAENPFEIVSSRDTNGHGSAMAGAAAGSRVNGGNTYLGAAPEADILVVKLKEAKQYLRDYYLLPQSAAAYAETDIMLALKYADSFARDFVRPVVICLGLGTNMGGHDGNSFLARYLNNLAVRRSRCIVVAGGNEGNAAHHYMGNLPIGGGGMENYRDVELRAGEGERGFILEFWGNQPDTYNVTIRSPGGESIPTMRLGLEQVSTYRFIYERTVITVQSILVEPNSGEQLILFRVQEPTPGIWNFRIQAVGEIHNGTFHMWLPIREFLSAETYFLEPSPDTTLTEPAMSEGVIGVAFYNDANESLYLESGRGYSRTGAIRPDFAAPGVNVSTIFGPRTGSSLAAALTGGCVAQFMQWAVVEQNSRLVSTEEIRNYFIKGAIRSPDQNYPNRSWGYGKMNLQGVFNAIAGT